MHSPFKARRDALLLTFGLLSAVLGAGGCASAGLAVAGPLFTGVAAIADRSVERTISADQRTAWGVTLDALSRMAVRLDETDKTGERWRFTGTGEAVTVHGTLERVTARMTKVSIRVEAGGLFSDKKTSEEILNQISVSLASLGLPVPEAALAPKADPSAERLSALQHEIDRLGAKLDEARNVRPPSSRPDAAVVPTLSTTSIMVIPASAGVPTLPVPDRTALREAAPTVIRVQPVAHETDLLRRSQGPSRQKDPAERIFPATLEPVGVLSPVQGLSSGRTGQ
jgi:uncharacterized protein DUF3568